MTFELVAYKNKPYLIIDAHNGNEYRVEKLLQSYDNIKSAQVYRIYEIRRKVGVIQQGNVHLIASYKESDKHEKHVIIESRTNIIYEINKLDSVYDGIADATIYRVYEIRRSVAYINGNKLYRTVSETHDTKTDKASMLFAIFWVLFVLVVLLISANQ